MPARAATIHWDAVTGDWFTPGNWNPAQVPQLVGGGVSGDDALVNNGGTASADSATAAVGAIAGARSITVGGGDAGGSLSGTLTSNGVDIEGQFGIRAGVASAGTTDASGTITATGANLFSGQSINVGTIGSPTASATANGNMTVTGGDVTALSRINIGAFSTHSLDPALVQEGTATGVVDIVGNVNGGIVVGQNIGGSSASFANGNLNISNGNLTLRSPGLTVGESRSSLDPSAGNASGRLSLSNGAITLPASPFSTSLRAGSASAGIANGTILTSAMQMDGGSFDDFIVGFASADGSASGRFASAGGDVSVEGDLAVGQTSVLNAGIPSAIGFADFGTGSVIGFDDAAGQFNVGNTRTFGLFNDGLGTATGEVIAHGISGFNTYKIGVTEGTIHNTGNRAQGILGIGAGGIRGIVDPLDARPDSILYIGATLASPNNSEIFGPGSVATGSVVVDGGSIADMRVVSVGVSGSPFAIGSGNGSATGALAVVNGNVTAEAFFVGFAHMNISTITIADEASATASGSFDMSNGTLTLQQPAFGSFINTATFEVGVGRSIESNSNPSTNVNPVNASGIANLTDVAVVGNVNLSIGNAISAFTERNTSGTGTVNIERGSVNIGSIRMGLASGVGSVARASLNLVDTSLAVDDFVDIGSGGDAQATLTSTNTNIGIGGDLRIGALRSFFDTSVVPATRGSLNMGGGLLDVGGDLLVGGQFQGSNGELLLDNVSGNVGGTLRLGRSSNAGSLFGNGEIRMNASTLAVNSGAFLDAGTLALTGSRMNVTGNLSTEFVSPVDGTYLNGISADARIELERSLLEVGGEFALGIDDVLQITLNGSGRGSEYGAINAGTVNLLGGALSVLVDFTLTENNYVFDLIASSSSDGILGDFASLDVSGYDPGYTLFSAIVLDDIGLGLGPTEIYRLTLSRIDPVPVPGALLLFLTALPALFFVRRRSSLAA